MLLASVLLSVALSAALSVSAWLSFWFLCCTRSPQQSLLCSGCWYVVYRSDTTLRSKVMQATPPLPLNTCSHRLWSLPVSAAGFLSLAVAGHMSRLFRSISDTPAHGLCAVPVQSFRTAQFLHLLFQGSADLYVHSRHFGLCAKIQVVWAYSAPLVQSAKSPRRFALFRACSPLYCIHQLQYKGGFHNVRYHSPAAAAKAWPPETSQKPDCKTLPHVFVQFTTCITTVSSI